MSATDWELVGRYVHDQAEDAFAELVRRHVGVVYGAALRQLRSAHLGGSPLATVQFEFFHE